MRGRIAAVPASRPVDITLPASGIRAAESLHATTFHMRRQAHEFHEVFLVLRGKTRVEIAASMEQAHAAPRRAEPGSVILVPRGVAHRFADERATNLVVVAIADTALDNCPGRRTLWARIMSAQADCPGRICGPITEHRPWRDLLAFERRAATPDNRLEQETMLNRLLCELAGGLEEPRSERPSERVRAFLEELPRRVHEPWTLDRAAAGVGISRRRFSELFRDAAGNSFVTTVQRLRVKAVQDLLATGAHSIVGAAYACGFEDLAHFYRVFHRHSGLAPGAWLEARVHPED